MAEASYAIKQHIAKETDIKAVKFMTADLLNPPKKDVLAFLGIPITPGGKPEQAPEALPRRAEIDVRPFFLLIFTELTKYQFIDVVAG